VLPHSLLPEGAPPWTSSCAGHWLSHQTTGPLPRLGVSTVITTDDARSQHRDKLTIAEVCADLGISRRTFYEWRAKNRAPKMHRIAERQPAHPPVPPDAGRDQLRRARVQDRGLQGQPRHHLQGAVEGRRQTAEGRFPDCRPGRQLPKCAVNRGPQGRSIQPGDGSADGLGANKG